MLPGDETELKIKEKKHEVSGIGVDGEETGEGKGRKEDPLSQAVFFFSFLAGEEVDEDMQEQAFVVACSNKSHIPLYIYKYIYSAKWMESSDIPRSRVRDRGDICNRQTGSGEKSLDIQLGQAQERYI